MKFDLSAIPNLAADKARVAPWPQVREALIRERSNATNNFRSIVRINNNSALAGPRTSPSL